MVQKTDQKRNPVFRTVTTTNGKPAAGKGIAAGLIGNDAAILQAAQLATTTKSKVPVMIVDRPVRLIEHPFLLALGIHEVLITRVGQPVEGSAGGLMVARLKAIDVYRSDKPVTKVAKATDTGDYKGNSAQPFTGIDISPKPIT